MKTPDGVFIALAQTKLRSQCFRWCAVEPVCIVGR